MRKLASIRQVRKKTPIEGADRIELVKVDGWNCVSRKDEFQVGDYCVYFEIDSFLPIEDKYSFLKSHMRSMRGEQGYRLRSARFKGVLSQGLAMPLSAFGDIAGSIRGLSLGTDVTELLNVKKYEAPLPACLQGEAKGRFPGFISKTDQERIQNIPDVLDFCSDVFFECTEKLDGSSMTVYCNEGEFGVCSRNLELMKTEGNTFWQAVGELGLEEGLTKFHAEHGRNIALQGELVGEGIQKNRLGIKGHQFRLFDIWDIDNRMYMTMDERNVARTLIAQYLSGTLLSCPVIFVRMLKEIAADVDGMLKFAEGNSLINTNRKREGVVVKSVSRVRDVVVSFKAINNSYLISGK